MTEVYRNSLKNAAKFINKFEAVLEHEYYRIHKLVKDERLLGKLTVDKFGIFTIEWGEDVNTRVVIIFGNNPEDKMFISYTLDGKTYSRLYDKNQFNNDNALRFLFNRIFVALDMPVFDPFTNYPITKDQNDGTTDTD